MAHDKPSNQPTWALYGEEKWTMGVSIHHYRYINVYFPTTRAVRGADTATLFLKDIPFSKVNLEDYFRQSTIDIISILTTPPSELTSILEAGDLTHNKLLKIDEILHRAEQLPEALPSTPSPRVPSKINKS